LFSILSGIQVAGNRLQFSDGGHGKKVFSGYQRFDITDIHRQIPDLLNFKQKKPNNPFPQGNPAI
jgi:hypothetical protein